MLIILLIIASTILLLVLVGLILNLSLYKRDGLQRVRQDKKKSLTTELHDLIFQRHKHDT